MIDPDDSIFPLLRERRAELRRDVPDLDRCFALSEAWLERLKCLPAFSRQVADGETILAGYIERDAESRD